MVLILNKKRDGRIVLFSVLALLITFIVFVSLVFAVDNWLEYGQNPASTHYVSTIGNNLEWTSINLNIGQNFEPIVTDLATNSGLEGIIWNGTQIFIIDLGNGGTIAQFPIGAELVGQPHFFNGKYFALVRNGSDSLFYELNLTGSSLDFSLKIGGSNDINSQGVKCIQSNGTNYCIFMDINNTVYRVNLDSDSFSKFEVTRGIRNTTISFLRIPAIGDLDGDGDYEAVFSFTNATSYCNGGCNQGSNLFAYDIDNNSAFTSFDFDGYLRITGNARTISSPLIHNFDGGLPEIVIITDDISNAQYRVYNSTGDLKATGWSSNAFESFTQPFVAKCNFNTTGSETGVGYFSKRNGTSTWYKFLWVDSNFSDRRVDRSMSSGAGAPFSPNQIVSTADFDNSGSSEIIASFYQHDSFTLTAFSCDETSNTEVGSQIKNVSILDDFYIPIIVDFDNDGNFDVIATKSSKTSMFKSLPTTDLEILKIIPIQVVEDADMVKGKSGIVRVVIHNNGNLDANATVNATLDGVLLNAYPGEILNKTINVSRNQTFYFSFKPTQTGTRTIRAEVRVG